MPSEYYIKNRERILAQNKRYRQENRETIRLWRKRNQEKISSYNKNKYNTDPLYKDDHRESALLSYYKKRLAGMDCDDPKFREVRSKMLMHNVLLINIRKAKKKRDQDNTR